MQNNILDERIKEVEKALQDALINYHFILGRLEELKHLQTQEALQQLAAQYTEIEK